MCKFLHLRKQNEDGTISGRGGATIAYSCLTPDSFVYAVAKCHDNDNFCKHTGRAKAAGRLKSKRQFSLSLGPISEKDFISDLIERFKENLL